MDTLNQKLNIIKLYFQADKKRIFAAVLIFTLAAGCAWATLAPKTLADEYGYTYGVGGYDYGADWGSYSPSYGGYDYSTPYYDSGYDYGSDWGSYSPSYGGYDYSTPYYGSGYDYSPTYSSYSPYSYDYYSTPDYYSPYDYGSGYDSGYGYDPYSDGSYYSDISENYTSITNENININENVNENIIRINDQFVYPYDYNNYYNDYYDGYGYDYNDYGNDYGQGGYGGGYDYYGDNPQFNIFTPYSHTQAFNRDYFLFDIKNDTKGTDYNDPVNAAPGDILTFSIYYHNAIDQTVAQNTKVRVNIPSYSGTNIVSTAYLSADNASQISETGTVYLSSAQSLEFISGSARWFPDGRNPDTDSSVPFPFGQSGNEIIGSGVNIGDIKGCWEWAGFVSLKVRVTETSPPPTQPPPTQPNLNLRKTVQNLTNPNGTDTDNAAKPGDTLKYTFTFANTGNTSLYNVRVIDDLPSYLSVFSADSGGIYDSNTNQTTWGLGTVPANSSRSVSYLVKVLSPPNGTVIRNTGIARADNISDVVSNEVRTTIGLPAPPPPPPPAPPVKVVTGAADILATGAAAATASGLAVVILYFVIKHFGLFTKFRLNWNTFGIRIRERMF